MPPHAARNHAIAGAFILLMLAALLAITVLVSGQQTWFQAKQNVLIHMDTAPNLKAGSPVLLAGFPVGRVLEVRIVEMPCPPGQKSLRSCYGVEALTELPAKYALHKDAKILFESSLVGSSAALDILDVGQGEKLGPTDSIYVSNPSMLTAVAEALGIGDKERENVSKTLEHIEKTTDQINKALPPIVEDVKVTAGNLKDATAKAKNALDEVNGILDDNRKNVADTVANVKSVTAKIDKDGEAILTNTKNASGKFEAILDENRKDIREALAHSNSIVDKVDKDVDHIITNVRAGSDDLKETLANLRTMSGDTKDVVVWNKGNLNKAIMNFAATSEHLKALAQEVRRAPWRLFATPDKKEVESLNLYDAARAFATAATDLEGISDTLRVMMEAKEKGIAVDAAVIQGMTDRLQDTFNHYQEAEEALWKEFDRVQK